METTQLIILSVLVFFTIYAVYFEYKEQNNAYLLGKAKEKDSISKSLHKLEICLSYDKKTIKWRRILLATTAAVFMIFLFIHKKIPRSKEFLLHFVLIFIAFYITWQSYVDRTSEEVVQFGRENISNLKESLKKERSFIFPW